MDLTAIILGIMALNVITFMAGCVLALYRQGIERRADAAELSARPSVPAHDSRLSAATRQRH
jgi:hypothetical protein